MTNVKSMALKTNFPTINSCQFIHKTWGGFWVVMAISSLNCKHEASVVSRMYM